MSKIVIGLFSLIFFCNVTNAQRVTDSQKQKIITEIDNLFIKSIKAGETVNISAISENVNDSLKAGFIDN